jgi:hypothetical protein
MTLQRIELRARRALYPLVKRSRLRELPHRPGLWIAIFVRPLLPAAAELLAQRFEQRKSAGLADLGLCVAEDEPQHVLLEYGDTGVIDERSFPQLLELALERFGLHQPLRCRTLLELG